MTQFTPLTAIQQRLAEGVPIGRGDEATVRRLWWAALETLQEDILLPMDVTGGLWMASPLPALYEPTLLSKLQGWVWAPEELDHLPPPATSLLPAGHANSKINGSARKISSYEHLALRQEDGHDPLLIIITPGVQIALALHGQPGERHLLMRSDPQTLGDLLRLLDQRLRHEDPTKAKSLRQALADLGPLRSNEELGQLFWPRLAERIADMAPSLTLQPIANVSEKPTPKDGDVEKASGEISLLEALTHEVRTPLATIRTLIRSLLRRSDLPAVVMKRLRQIDAECTEQIDRFGLIFHAVELEKIQPEKASLARTDLGKMLEMLVPGWNQQLERRGIALHLDLTPNLPAVLSDPGRLEPMLGGLIDRSSRGLPPGGCLVLQLRAAGHRLKLQILSQCPESSGPGAITKEQIAELGPVLSWNPSTGSLQLSQGATQRMLASLGGRLTNRRDRGLTVFFPIDP